MLGFMPGRFSFCSFSFLGSFYTHHFYSKYYFYAVNLFPILKSHMDNLWRNNSGGEINLFRSSSIPQPSWICITREVKLKLPFYPPTLLCRLFQTLCQLSYIFCMVALSTGTVGSCWPISNPNPENICEGSLNCFPFLVKWWK